MRPSFSGLRGVSLPMRTKAQQGARANDHGCHVSCSEQHEPRQPRSWLILNVRQKIPLMPKTKKDLYAAIAQKIGGGRGAVMRATLQQSILEDLFRSRMSEAEFALQLKRAEEDLSTAFNHFFEIVKAKNRSLTWVGAN